MSQSFMNAEVAKDPQKSQKNSISHPFGGFCDFCGHSAPSAFKNFFPA